MISKYEQRIIKPGRIYCVKESPTWWKYIQVGELFKNYLESQQITFQISTLA